MSTPSIDKPLSNLGYVLAALYFIGFFGFIGWNNGIHSTILLFLPLVLQLFCIAVFIVKYGKDALNESFSLVCIMLVLLTSSLIFFLAQVCYHNEWLIDYPIINQICSCFLVFCSLLIVGAISYWIKQTIYIRRQECQSINICASCPQRLKCFCKLEHHPIVSVCILLSFFLCVTYYLSYAFAFTDMYERIGSNSTRVALYRHPHLIDKPRDGSSSQSETSPGCKSKDNNLSAGAGQETTNCEPCSFAEKDPGFQCESDLPSDGDSQRGKTPPFPDPKGPLPGMTTEPEGEREFVLYFRKDSPLLVNVDERTFVGMNPDTPIDQLMQSLCINGPEIRQLSDCKAPKNWDKSIDAFNRANLFKIYSYLQNNIDDRTLVINLFGHASTDGEYDRNRILSAQRATSVLTQIYYYISRIDPEKISLIKVPISSGTGEDPKYQSDDFLFRWQNHTLTLDEQRSVEVVLVPVQNKFEKRVEKLIDNIEMGPICQRSRRLVQKTEALLDCAEKHGRCLEQLHSKSANDYCANRLSVLDFIYFTIYTITTTGYGDIVPITDQAKFIASLANIYELFFIVIFFNVLFSYTPRKTTPPSSVDSSTGGVPASAGAPPAATGAAGATPGPGAISSSSPSAPSSGGSPGSDGKSSPGGAGLG